MITARLKHISLLTLSTLMMAPTAFSQQSVSPQAPQVDTYKTAHHYHNTEKTYNIYLNAAYGRYNNWDHYLPYLVNGINAYVDFEWYPARYNGDLSIGFEPDYEKYRTRYRNDDDVATQNIFGAGPYISYLSSPCWLWSAQLGYYREHIDRRFSNGTIRLKRPADNFLALGSVTWLGPKKEFTASIRFGGLFQSQDLKSGTDSAGNFYNKAHFDDGSLSVSTRLKYKPNKTWDAYLQVGYHYRTKLTYRPLIYRSTTGNLRSKLEVGPAIHWNFYKEWQIKASYLYNWGYGYSREHIFGLRLRLGL